MHTSDAIVRGKAFEITSTPSYEFWPPETWHLPRLWSQVMLVMLFGTFDRPTVVKSQQ